MLLSRLRVAAFKPATVFHRPTNAYLRVAGPAGPAAVHRLRLVKAQDDKSTPTSETSTQQQQPQDQESLPIWVRREKERELQAASGKGGLPWPLYLLLSVIVAIASVGSIFEYVDKNPVFGVIPPDSPLWAPVLGLFAFTGLPLAGFLFFKGVNAANEAAEKQDKLDGYIK